MSKNFEKPPLPADQLLEVLQKKGLIVKYKVEAMLYFTEKLGW